MFFSDEELLQRLRWLITLRWAGILGVLAATHVAREIQSLSFSMIPVYAILGSADESLYRAKGDGGNRMVAAGTYGA